MKIPLDKQEKEIITSMGTSFLATNQLAIEIQKGVKIFTREKIKGDMLGLGDVYLKVLKLPKEAELLTITCRKFPRN